MRDNFQDSRETLSSEEGVGPLDLCPFMQKMWCNGTRAITDVVEVDERRKRFGKARNMTWFCFISGVL